MSANTTTVERYIDGFNKSDHEQILSCLTDDIDWTVFGYFRLHGKEAYDREIENPAFTGSPVVSIVRMVEQDDVVMAEMTLEARRSSGELMRAAMAEVFVMRDGRITRATRLCHRAQGERLQVTTSACSIHFDRRDVAYARDHRRRSSALQRTRQWHPRVGVARLLLRPSRRSKVFSNHCSGTGRASGGSTPTCPAWVTRRRRPGSAARTTCSTSSWGSSTP